MPDHFDLLSKIYDRVIPPPDPGEWDELLRLPCPGWVLDAGGGTGRVASALQGRTGTIVVSDLSFGMLREARHKRGVRPTRVHAAQLPFPDGTFDRILVVDALHHFCDQRAALDDLLRVLRPGGRLVIEEPDATRFVVRLIALAEKVALMRSRFYTPEAIGEMIAARGRIAEIRRGSRFRAWIIVDA